MFHGTLRHYISWSGGRGDGQRRAITHLSPAQTSEQVLHNLPGHRQSHGHFESAPHSEHLGADDLDGGLRSDAQCKVCQRPTRDFEVLCSDFAALASRRKANLSMRLDYHCCGGCQGVKKEEQN
ncbi:hypothetical protein V6Z79_002378 [Aspergillus fumigatus]